MSVERKETSRSYLQLRYNSTVVWCVKGQNTTTVLQFKYTSQSGHERLRTYWLLRPKRAPTSLSLKSPEECWKQFTDMVSNCQRRQFSAKLRARTSSPNTVDIKGLTPVGSFTSFEYNSTTL